MYALFSAPAASGTPPFGSMVVFHAIYKVTCRSKQYRQDRCDKKTVQVKRSSIFTAPPAPPVEATSGVKKWWRLGCQLKKYSKDVSAESHEGGYQSWEIARSSKTSSGPLYSQLKQHEKRGGCRIVKFWTELFGSCPRKSDSSTDIGQEVHTFVGDAGMVQSLDCPLIRPG